MFNFDFTNPVLWYITGGLALLWVVFTLLEKFILNKKGVDPQKIVRPEKDYITEIYEARENEGEANEF